jgi:Na+/H+-dicarboxylate symporter
MVGDRLTGKQRLGILLSFIWLSLVALLASLGAAGFEWGAFYMLGVFPIAVV